MDGTYVKFSALEEYINTLNSVFQKCCQTQDDISASYNSVTLLWRDKISALTGQGLNEVGKTVMNMHDALSRVLHTLNTRYEHLSQGYAERSWNAQFTPCEFQVKLKLEGNMDTDTINGTTVEGIKSFERALDTYIENTVENVSKIRSAHDIVHEGWRDEQYDRTNDKINDFIGTMNKQLNALKALQGWIAERRKQFEEALNISVNE